MLPKIVKQCRVASVPQFCISVYEGISPALLATMSLSQGVKGNNNQQLIESLVKSNIIRNKALVEAMKKVDRKWFIDESDSKKSYYENRPYKISGGQTMTDVFTHAVILEEVSQKLQQIIGKWKGSDIKCIQILDIGTGHGYLAYTMATLLQSMLANQKQSWKCKVLGIDSNAKSIQQCNQLSNRVSLNRIHSMGAQLGFQQTTLENKLLQRQHYDIVVGGFYMPPLLHASLLQKLKQSNKQLGRATLGIWPTDSSSGQSLYRFSYQFKNNKQVLNKHQIMSTMFSMPVVKSSVSQFFVQESNEEDKQEAIQTPQTNQANELQLRQQLKKLKWQKRQQQKQRIKQQLKAQIAKQSQMLGKKLSLQEMKQLPSINALLEQLNKR